MKIGVIGAGVAGLASALELARDGHNVIVLERHSSVAAEASFAPSGLTSLAALLPWAAAGLPGEPLQGLLPGAMRDRLDSQRWRWRWGHGRARRRSEAAAGARLALLGLARYSQSRGDELRERLSLDCERTRGLLVLMRSEQGLAGAAPHVQRLRDLGLTVRELDAAACHALEPALDPDHPLAGGLHLPDEEAVNARQFAHQLRDAGERAGVEFRLGSRVRALAPYDGGCMLTLEQLALTTGFAVSRVTTRAETGAATLMTRRARAAARFLDPVAEERFDAVVLAAGAASARWLPELGLRQPLLPLHGYTLTAPLRSVDRSPRGAVIDAERRAVITRIGDRARIGWGAELGGDAAAHRRDAAERMHALLTGWFPGCVHPARPQVWKGASAVLPDGMPRIGASARTGVWVNVGHGAGGCALALGSARLLADLIAGRTPAVDTAPFDPQRGA